MFKKIPLGLLLALGISFGVQAQGTVPQEFINAQTGTTYTFVPRDCSKLVTLANAAAVAVTLPVAGTNFFAGCFIDVLNKGPGTVTITPTTSTIDARTTFVLSTNEGIRITTDSVNYFTQAMHPGVAAVGAVGAVAGATSGLTLGNTAPSISNTTPAAWIRYTLTDGNIYFTPAWR